MTINTSVQLDAGEVRNLFEQVGAPAETVENFVEIFESAVATQVAAQVQIQLDERVAELEAKHEQHIAQLDEQANAYREILQTEQSAKLDSYVEHFAAQFADENKPIIESNIRAGMFDSLMSGMTALMKAHGVVLTNEQVDAQAELQAQLDEVTAQLNEAQAQVVVLTNQINEGKRAAIIDDAVANLTESQAEKVRVLLADTLYTEGFGDKVARVVSAIGAATPLTESTQPEVKTIPVQDHKVVDRMSMYIDAASRTASKFR